MAEVDKSEMLVNAPLHALAPPARTAVLQKKEPRLTPWEDPRPWDREQRPAGLVSRGADGKVTLSGVRWGFDEIGAPSAGGWAPRFVDTVIDPGAIREVYFGVEPFPGAGHALMIFEFDPAHPLVNSKGETDTRLVLSIEARKKEGEDWGALVGLQKRFGVVYQLGSFSDAVQKTARLNGHRLELRRLDLSQAQRERLVGNALAEAVKDRVGEYYHTTRNSCYSGQLRLLNSVLPAGQQIGFLSPWTAGVTYKATAITPTFSGVTLKRSGLLTGEPARVLQADEKLYPKAQKAQGALGKAVRALSESPLWGPGLRLGGAVAGAAALSGLGPVGLIAGAVIGQAVGSAAADLADVKTHVEYESPKPYYPAFVS